VERLAHFLLALVVCAALPLLAATTTSHLARGRRLVHSGTLHSAPRIASTYPPSPHEHLALALSPSPTPSHSPSSTPPPPPLLSRCTTAVKRAHFTTRFPPVPAHASPPEPTIARRPLLLLPGSLVAACPRRLPSTFVCGAVSARAKPPLARHEGTPTSPRRSPQPYEQALQVCACACAN
jgi:hypothetical protein